MGIELIGEANADGAGLWAPTVNSYLSCGPSNSGDVPLRGLGTMSTSSRRSRLLTYCLLEEDRQQILHTCNEPAYALLPPSQIEPALADLGLFIGSETSC
jgi:putative transposase